MNEKQKKKCHKIIHIASTACAGVGAGLAQLPCADSAVITPIQITMIISLGKVFNKSITKDGATTLIATMAATLAGRTASQIIIGWIPGYGNVVNATTAAAITEAMGWAIAKVFDGSFDENDESAPIMNAVKGVLENMSDK